MQNFENQNDIIQMGQEAHIKALQHFENKSDIVQMGQEAQFNRIGAAAAAFHKAIFCRAALTPRLAMSIKPNDILCFQTAFRSPLHPEASLEDPDVERTHCE